ncbi:MAG: hypothetical protein D3909_03065 [Candidatus Electrothrix sp. ATG1]|nr:hypothetical protein [Candidatus Electrothrix sp. ATG1]
MHRFGYVGNNPVSYWDWYGFISEEEQKDLKGSEQWYMRQAGGLGEALFFIGEDFSWSVFDGDHNQYKQAIESGGFDDFFLFRNHYRYGNGEPVNIDVNDLYKTYESLRSLTKEDFYKPSVKENNNGHPEIVIVMNKTIYGHTAVAYDPEKGMYVKDEFYNFEWKDTKDCNGLKSVVSREARNGFTLGAKVIHGTGTPFETKFNGYIPLQENKTNPSRDETGFFEEIKYDFNAKVNDLGRNFEWWIQHCLGKC